MTKRIESTLCIILAIILIFGLTSMAALGTLDNLILWLKTV